MSREHRNNWATTIFASKGWLQMTPATIGRCEKLGPVITLEVKHYHLKVCGRFFYSTYIYELFRYYKL